MSRFLPHSSQQLRRLYMLFQLKRVSLTQKKKGQLSTPSREPTQPPVYHMLPSKTSPTVQTPEASENCFQNHLGTSGIVSIRRPSMWYLLMNHLTQSSSWVRTQSFSCLRSARPASRQFSMQSWLWVAKHWSEISHQSWQWAASLKGQLPPQLVSVLPIWLPTTSTITRMSLEWQASIMSTKSFSLPKFQLSSQMLVAQQPWQPPSLFLTTGEIQIASKPMPWMQSRLLMIPLQPPPQQQPRLSQPYPAPSFLAKRSVNSWQMDLLRHSSLSAVRVSAMRTSRTLHLSIHQIGDL